MIKDRGVVEFPEFRGVNANMMPVRMGDWGTVPEAFRQYVPMMLRCKFDEGEVVYLTINESVVGARETQRRAGIHTDATASIGWGGSPWGGTNLGGWGHCEGIYIANTDGDCEAWAADAMTDDEHGTVPRPVGEPMRLEANELYRISDRTPHQALPASETHERQFFRFVSPLIGAWWAKHSTENPMVAVPSHIPVFEHSKFAA